MSWVFAVEESTNSLQKLQHENDLNTIQNFIFMDSLRQNVFLFRKAVLNPAAVISGPFK